MHREQKTLAWLNVIGGLAVLGSYAYGLGAHPETRHALWGAVPQSIQPLYTISMLLAAIGYFPFTFLLLFRVEPAQARIAGRLGYGWFTVFYMLILLPSALWMPLTFLILDRWSALLWLAIRAVLALVALGSVGLLVSLLALTPRPPKALYVLAILGAVAFCIQTAVLDAIVWPAFFPTASQ